MSLKQVLDGVCLLSELCEASLKSSPPNPKLQRQNDPVAQGFQVGEPNCCSSKLRPGRVARIHAQNEAVQVGLQVEIRVQTFCHDC